MLSQSILTVYSFLRIKLQFRHFLSQSCGTSLKILIFVDALLGGRNTSTQLHMWTSIHSISNSLFANHTGELMSIKRQSPACVRGLPAHVPLRVALHRYRVAHEHGILNIRIDIILCNCELRQELLPADVIVLLELRVRQDTVQQ